MARKVKKAQTNTFNANEMKYSKNLFQFSNGSRAINYSRFIIVTNGTKILFLVFFPLVVCAKKGKARRKHSRRSAFYVSSHAWPISIFLHSQHVRARIFSASLLYFSVRCSVSAAQKTWASSSAVPTHDDCKTYNRESLEVSRLRVS